MRKLVIQSRWHEVLRLLIGSLEQTESQRFLLERIRADGGDKDATPRALLLGGCLLDGVDAAEELGSLRDRQLYKRVKFVQCTKVECG